MPEYIEREALIAEYDRVHKGPAGGARKLMVEAPAADVVEVKHGKWDQKPARFGSNYKLYGCSICGWTFTFKPDYSFYPRCGADMREGADE